MLNNVTRLELFIYKYHDAEFNKFCNLSLILYCVILFKENKEKRSEESPIIIPEDIWARFSFQVKDFSWEKLSFLLV